MPLKLAPSGGARNPYEAYVFAANVAEINGLYHYSAYDHGLARISEQVFNPVIALGGQEWAGNCGAIVFLVSNFQRTMWKYPHPGAYKVVLIEAGHVGQNMVTVGSVISISAYSSGEDALLLNRPGLRLYQITRNLAASLSKLIEHGIRCDVVADQSQLQEFLAVPMDEILVAG
jgi:hypothetical protein